MLQIPYLYAELNVSFHIQYVTNSVSIPYLICGIKTYVSVCCKFRTLFRTLQTESKSTFSVLVVCCKFHTYSVFYIRNQKGPFQYYYQYVVIPYLICGIKNVPFQYVINSVLIYRIKKYVTNSVPYMRNQNIPFQYYYYNFLNSVHFPYIFRIHP